MYTTRGGPAPSGQKTRRDVMWERKRDEFRARRRNTPRRNTPRFHDPHAANDSLGQLSARITPRKGYNGGGRGGGGAYGAPAVGAGYGQQPPGTGGQFQARQVNCGPSAAPGRLVCLRALSGSARAHPAVQPRDLTR